MKIIHIDLDSYYASIEARDNPSLRGIPLAVGGSQFHRGVIATCSYEARRYGVHSAMSTARALQLCPQLTVIAGNMQKYKAVSKQIHQIFARYTSIIEPLSLDEAYLDVTESKFFHGSATLIAQQIRADIEKELELTASAGVASVKFIAKIASDINKPNGLFVVKPDELNHFVKALPLGKIPGVGKVTLAKLNQLGLYKGQDVQNFDKAHLLAQFGKFGRILWERCHGIDNRQVITERIRKSVGVERTLATDIYSSEECKVVMQSLYQELIKRLSAVSPDLRIVKQGVKLKFADFQQTTVEHKQLSYDNANFIPLLQEALSRQQGRGIRLIGLSVGLPLQTEPEQQLSFEW